MDNYDDFIIADNEVEESTEEVANPQIEEETAAETEVQGEETAEPSTQPKEPTETQRVAQRIKEAQEKARQEGVDQAYQRLYKDDVFEIDGKEFKINSEADYLKVKEYSDRQKQLEALQEQGIDPKILEDAINNNPTVKKANEIITKQQQEEAKKEADMKFLEYFKEVNGREFDGEKDKFTDDEVRQYQEGKNLIEIYKDKVIKQLLDKNKILEQNQKNKQKAPIVNGVATHGSEEIASEDDFMRGFNSVK